MSTAYQWIEARTKQTCSPLARNVADVLARMGDGGIYNRPISWDRVDWTDERLIEVNWRGGLCNWDSPALSALWGWAAVKMLRVEVEPSSPRHIKLRFWQRHSRDGGIAERLPVIPEQLAWIGIDLGVDLGSPQSTEKDDVAAD